MLNIYLARHGETPFNADGNRYCGKTDVELNEKGISQAGNLRNLIRNIRFDAVYCSPLRRAYKTAVTAAPDRQVCIDKRLTELDFGRWEGKTRSEFIAEAPDLWHLWNTDPEHHPAGGTGETASELVKRLSSFMGELHTNHPEGNVLLVAHNAVNRFLMAHLLGMPLKNYRKIRQQNSRLSLISFSETEGYVLEQLNCS
ncbi:histidine phosphatase family protein [Sinomicrobium soli]|uniref:histidine phosphatase family protein n=1 Tax=Sinomicrobium sp. N-1-3-6 TaxID=2219864 RepID=UPI000DCD48C8|nr:histidine phosphatase family protein [Sinomicrobium sp. N-1-3-6]RAV28414.1 histidine phosphatase family protein [Sinomicrobium sp. N-1-3-6]